MQTLREQGVPVISFQQALPGDAVFCHSSGIVGWAIRFGQWISRLKYRTWNHIGWLDRPIYGSDGVTILDWYVGQAIAKGVDNHGLLSNIAPDGKHEVVSLTAFPTIVLPLKGTVIRADHLAQLRSQLGVRYGFLTIFSEVFTILTPKFVRLDFRRDNTWICSALYSYGLHSGGGLIVGDIYQVMPAQVAGSALTGTGYSVAQKNAA